MPKTVHIGLLFNYDYSFYRSVLRGVREFAETRRNWVFRAVSVDKGGLRWCSKKMPEILLTTIDSTASAKAVKCWHRPIVNISPICPNSQYPIVKSDNDSVGRLAAEHFLERGFTSFAFGGHRTLLFSVEREAAYCAVIRKKGFDVDCHYVQKGHPFEAHAQHWYLDRRALNWLLRLPKPVGIFVPSDLLGTELTGYCQDLELLVPADVAILGAGNDELYCGLARPTLSSVMLNGEIVGHETARLVDRLLSGEKPPSQPILVQPSGICVRQSTDVLAIDDEDVIKVAYFIREHFHHAITVSDVLKAIPVSRRALEIRFRRTLGRGIAQEINRVRLEHCKRLLAETDFQIPLVAKQSGFSSSRQLGAAFRREFGISPSGFRKQTRFTGGTSERVQGRRATV